MVALVTCKNEEDPMKNKGARVVTTLIFKMLKLKTQMKGHMMLRLFDKTLFFHYNLCTLSMYNGPY